MNSPTQKEPTVSYALVDFLKPGTNGSHSCPRVFLPNHCLLSWKNAYFRRVPSLVSSMSLWRSLQLSSLLHLLWVFVSSSLRWILPICQKKPHFDLQTSLRWGLPQPFDLNGQHGNIPRGRSIGALSRLQGRSGRFDRLRSFQHDLGTRYRYLDAHQSSCRKVKLTSHRCTVLLLLPHRASRQQGLAWMFVWNLDTIGDGLYVVYCARFRNSDCQRLLLSLGTCRQRCGPHFLVSSSSTASFSLSLLVLEAVGKRSLCCDLRRPKLLEYNALQCAAEISRFRIAVLLTARFTDGGSSFLRLRKNGLFLPRFVPGKVTLDVSSTSLTRFAGTTSHHSSPPPAPST